jgi:hypothetical protein
MTTVVLVDAAEEQLDEFVEWWLAVLDAAVVDRTATVRVVAYDLCEPDVVGKLEKLGKRLSIIIDNSGDHAHATSAESQAANTLQAAGATVKRQKMGKLQHNKTIVVDGKVKTVVCGSTSFTWRGFFVQSNNAMVLWGAAPVKLFADAYDVYFTPGTVARFAEKVFVYGISDKKVGIQVQMPNGNVAPVYPSQLTKKKRSPSSRPTWRPEPPSSRGSLGRGMTRRGSDAAPGQRHKRSSASPIVVRDHDAGVQREALIPCAQALDAAHGRLAVLRRAPRRRRLGLDLRQHVDALLHAVLVRLVGEPARDPAHDPIEDRHHVGVGGHRVEARRDWWRAQAWAYWLANQPRTRAPGAARRREGTRSGQTQEKLHAYSFSITVSASSRRTPGSSTVARRPSDWPLPRRASSRSERQAEMRGCPCSGSRCGA